MTVIESIAKGEAPVGLASETYPVSRRRTLYTAMSVVLGSLSLLTLSTNAFSAPTHSVQKDVAGFPTWYQDANGIRVTLCYNPNDANCVAPVSATYNPALPLSFPTPGNYPDELFYSAADSDLVVVNDSASCPSFTPTAPVAGAGSTIHMALEAAFLNGTLTPGDQMVFGRLRVISKAGNGLCPANWYTFRTPYGPITLQTDQNAEIKGVVAAAATNDVGCLPGPVSPCNFDLAQGAPVLSVGLLRQVNGVGASSAAAGYLGNGVTSGTITGGILDIYDKTGTGSFNRFEVVKWPAGVTPATSGVGVDCTDLDCVILGATSNFAVAAKLAGPLGSQAVLDFGGQVAGTSSASLPLALTNLGSGTLGQGNTTIDSFALSGVGAGNFVITGNDCVGVPLIRDAACNVSVQFTPSANGFTTASLDVFGNGGQLLHSVTLNGTGITAGQLPSPSIAPASGVVDFGAVRLTNAGKVQVVTVSNATGAAPLSVLPSLTGSKAFSIAYDNCSAAFLAAGASCDIGLQFVPTAVAPVDSTLNLATNSGPLSVFVMGHGTGGIAAVSATVDAVNTFPDWYQDENGLRVGQCDNPANTLCVATPVAGGVSFPTNYPDEWFYYLAQSTPMAVSDPACSIQPGNIFVEAGMEAAFLGPIGPNQGITFGRLRIVSHGGLCPNTAYKLTHPYGETVLSTDGAGLIKPNPGTSDVGCLGAPCDYTVALSAPVFESFLTQSVHPDGYLGDPLSPSTVTGAPFIDPDGQPANYFKVERLDAAGTGQPLAFTTEFAVSGRLVGPMLASPAQYEFEAIEVLSTSSAQQIIFTNDGPFPVALDATLPLELIGTHVSNFKVVSTTCTAGLSLAHAQTCAANVTFTPSFTGVRSAALRIKHSGGNNPLSVALSGIGNSPAGTAAISASVETLRFTDLHVGVFSESASVIFSNIGGSAPLLVNAPSITGPFAIVDNGCADSAVAPGLTCTMKVQFQPSVIGAFAGTLTVPSNAASGSMAIPVKAKATNVTATVSAALDTAGLPIWYQDGNGVRVEPCLTQDGNCVLLADAGFDPTQPIVFGINYPGESFYNLTDSETISIPADASCGGTGGLALLRIGTEVAYATLPPTLGGQLIFNRLRIVAGGLCPNTVYNFVHPYGVSSLTTDGNGDIRPKTGTLDNPNVVGTLPLTPGLLQWDPNVAPAAPVGYLGDARTLHPIVGSQYRPTPTSEPANYFKVVRASGAKLVGETKLFTVSGRLPGPVVSSLSGKDFGIWEQAKTSTAQQFTITNLSDLPVSAFIASLTGANANQFAISANACAAATLNQDQSCTIDVQFKPTAAAGAGAKAATLVLGHNGLRSPLNISLKGTSVAVGSPALSVTPTTLAFGTVVVGASGTQQTVTIRNAGSGEMRVGALAVGGANPGQYAITGNTCLNVLTANAACTMTINFTPTSSGSKPASIVVSATDVEVAGGHIAVIIPSVTESLTGTGGQGTLSLSASTFAITGKVGGPGTAKLTVTNSGTAPFSLSATPFTFTAVSANNPVPKFSAAATGCTNVAVGKNCQVTVTFTVPAGTATNTLFSVDMKLNSNASNTPVVRLNGTVK